MRVMVYKAVKGLRTVLILPAVGSGTRPVVLKGLTRPALRDAVRKAMLGMSSTPPAAPG